MHDLLIEIEDGEKGEEGERQKKSGKNRKKTFDLDEYGPWKVVASLLASEYGSLSVVMVTCPSLGWGCILSVPARCNSTNKK